MTEFKPKHILCFYGNEDKWDLETALAATQMRLFISDLIDETRKKVKYEEQDHWQEFRDCIFALLDERDLQKLF